ncbi:UNVERIFIED_CONTAM: hypothetical protein Slati_3318900 [Sesamum latifolium]|uniref:Uncharacterized protein n=1 Tax=Sesamum latifolium TaxID=2727402 RepID=A0AAW2V157_9LAMI
MAEQYPQAHANNTSAMPPAEAKDRGCFDFMRKKEDKAQEDLVMTDMSAAKQSTDEEKHTLMDELQRTHTHSSSSSEEEVEEGGERKKKKKKGLKEAIKRKLSGTKRERETNTKTRAFLWRNAMKKMLKLLPQEKERVSGEDQGETPRPAQQG